MLVGFAEGLGAAKTYATRDRYEIDTNRELIESVRVQLSQAAKRAGIKAIVLDAETIPFIDVSAARLLDGLSAELKRDGVCMLLARDIGRVRDVLRMSGEDISQTSVYPSVRTAVEVARSGS